MSVFKTDHYIDVQDAPARQTELVTDRRRPDRIHDVSPALIPLLRNPAGVAVVDDLVPMPRAIAVALQGIVLFLGSFSVWTWASLGAGISTAIAVWFATGHGSWMGVAAANLLSFPYGIGMLM
jgi:hypothetical protein